jgi:hypothetical protein
MAKHKKRDPKLKKGLDAIPWKRGRGRPPHVVASQIRGRADNYREMLDQIWDDVGGALLKAKTPEEVVQTLETGGRYLDEFRTIAPLIVEIICKPDFPKRRKAQINFMADSLAARGLVTPRSSRDICARERWKEEHAQRIIRFEFYVECSCGYKGPARDNACRKCGAVIAPSLGGLFAPRSF